MRFFPRITYCRAFLCFLTLFLVFLTLCLLTILGTIENFKKQMDPLMQLRDLGGNWGQGGGGRRGPGGLWQPPDVEQMVREGKIIDPTIPMSLLTAFMRRLVSNQLLDGNPSPLDPVSKDLSKLFMTPFVKWSPRRTRAPQGNESFPRGSAERLAQTDMAAIQFSMALGGMRGMAPGAGSSSIDSGEDFMDMFSGLFNLARHHAGWVERDVSEMKARLMMGAKPVSETRWKQRGLDEVERWNEAEELVALTIKAGRWVVEDERVRMVYKDVKEVMRGFDDEVEETRRVEAARQESGNGERDDGFAPGPGFVDVWDEFYLDYLNYVLDKTHDWVIEKLDAMFAVWKAELLGLGSWTPGMPLKPEIMFMLERLGQIQHMRITASYRLLLIPDAFRKFADPPPGNNRNGTVGNSQVVQYPGEMTNWTRYKPDQPLDHAALPLGGNVRRLVWSARIKHLTRQRTGEAAPQPLTQSAEEFVESHEAGKHAVGVVRVEMRGPVRDVAEEMWVVTLRDRMDPQEVHGEFSRRVTGTEEGIGNLDASPSFEEGNTPTSPRTFDTWGFVGYRLGYKHCSEEWETFQQRFGAAVMASLGQGEKVKGAGKIRESCRVRWIDGRDLGLEENDVEGAKKHYASLVQNELRKTYLPSDVFLVADEFSIGSFLRKGGDMPFYLSRGMEMGWVTAVDRSWTPPAPSGQPGGLRTGGEATGAGTSSKDKRGYNGQVKMVAESLFHELFPGLLIHGDKYLENFWTDAMCHPHLVYAGPLAERERTWYQVLNVTQNAAFEQVLDMLREDGTLEGLLRGEGGDEGVTSGDGDGNSGDDGEEDNDEHDEL